MQIFGMDLRTAATIALITIAALCLMFPPLKASLEAWLKSWLAELKGGTSPTPTSTGETPIAATRLDADEIIKNRALSLKSACPKADPELRLKWLESGMDDHRARVDYIGVLEKKLETTKQ